MQPIYHRTEDGQRLVEQVLSQRKRAGLSPVQPGRYRSLSVFGLTDMSKAMAMVRSQAGTLLASAVDNEHAAEMADGEFLADQDWQGDRTEWGFPDGSVLVAEGQEMWTEQAEEMEDA